MKVLTLLTLICCTPFKEKQSNLDHNNKLESSVLEVEEMYQVNKSSNFFSSTTAKDTFILELRGNYITKSKIRFRIISFQNEVIYEDEFDTMALYGFGPDASKPNPDSINVEKHLLKRFDNFFNSENFLKPAIKESANYEELYNSIISEKEWSQIKSNSGAIGFSFTLWEESISYIVYSENRKKAILYQVCC